MDSNYDAIIVGGGPGGACCALRLAEKGKKVLLLEKAVYPRDKTCGDAISGKTVKSLKTLGLLDQVQLQPKGDVYGCAFSSPNMDYVEIPFKQDKTYGGAPGYCVRRYNLDNVLFSNAKKYSDTIEGFTVTELITENGFVVGVRGINANTKKTEEYKGKIIIGADGANSVVATKLGVGKNDPKHEIIALRAYYKGITGMKNNIELHFVDSILPGYFWIFPLENGFSNVGVGMITDDIKKKGVDLRKAMIDITKNHPLFKERFVNATIEGGETAIKGWTLPVGSHHRKNHFNGALLIGDAASLIDPFTGEGMGNASYSGIVAADVSAKAIEENNVSEERLKEYDTELWKEIGPELGTSYNLQKWGRHKFLLNMILKKASRNQKIREVVSGMLANEIPRGDLVNPMFLLQVLMA